MKIGKKELQAIFVLLGLVAIGCAYLLGYKKITEKTAALEAENRVLKAEAEAYKSLYERQPEFETATSDFNEAIPEMEEEFVYGFSTEDAIMYMANLEDSQNVEDYVLTVKVDDDVKKKVEAEAKEKSTEENDKQENEIVKVNPVEGVLNSKSMVRSEAIKAQNNSVASLNAKTKVTVDGYVVNEKKEKWYHITFEDANKKEQEGFIYFDLLKIKDEIIEAKEEIEEPETDVADEESDENTKVITLPIEYAQGSVKLAYINMGTGDALNYIPEIETDPAFASGAISMPTVPDDGINVLTNNVSYGYTVSYDGFKDMVKYLNTVGGAKDIKDVSLTYDRSTGILNGYMSVDFYVLSGTDNQYVPLRIPSVDLSTDNIFGTIEFTEEDLKAFLEAQKEANAAK